MYKFAAMIALAILYFALPARVFAAESIEFGNFVSTSITSIIVIATIASTFFLAKGGWEYIVSNGSPEALEHAKKTIRNSLIGLVLVLSASTFSALLQASFHTSPQEVQNILPQLTPIAPLPNESLISVLSDLIGGLLEDLLNSAIGPIADGVVKFLLITPAIAANRVIFNFWLVMVGVANTLLALVIALIGLQFMSASTFGFEELELRKIMPRIGLAFLGANTSIFLIDWIVRLNDTLVSYILNETDGGKNIILNLFPNGTGIFFINILLVILLAISVVLLLFYIKRLVVIALGAVLSPIIFLLWAIPKAADSVEIYVKSYLMIIFSTFIHAVILQLGAKFLDIGDANDNPLISSLVGISLIMLLLKSSSAMVTMSYYNTGKAVVKESVGKLINVIQTSENGSKRAVAARKVIK